MIFLVWMIALASLEALFEEFHYTLPIFCFSLRFEQQLSLDSQFFLTIQG